MLGSGKTPRGRCAFVGYGRNSAILPFFLSLWREMADFTISSKDPWIRPMSFGQENYSMVKPQVMIRAYLFDLFQVLETSKYGILVMSCPSVRCNWPSLTVRDSITSWSWRWAHDIKNGRSRKWQGVYACRRYILTKFPGVWSIAYDLLYCVRYERDK
jgi:hypothetical protein